MDLREFRGILILVPAWRAPSPEGPFTPPHPQSPKFLRETSLEPQIPEGNFSGPPNPRGKFPGAPNSREKLPQSSKSQRETSPEPQIPEGKTFLEPQIPGGKFPGAPNPRGKLCVVLCKTLATKQNKAPEGSTALFGLSFIFFFFFWSCF